MVPESLGRYRILRLLGSGGMGEVFEGYDDRLERPVAIKGIHHDRVSPERRERLRREALSTAALSHPAITHIYEILTEADTDWVVMEFVEGSSLAEVIVKGPPSPAEVASIGAEIAEALAEAHRRGIVHRDIKTENVMLTPAGHVKVLDFGLAKWVGARASADERLTTDGIVVGTTRAMSPEQALGRDVDSRSDIFSLGSTLYELATGKPAFHGTTPMETMHKVARCEFEPLVEVGPGLPAALVSVIERCMAREPGDRYQTADGLARDLRRVASSATDATAAEPAVRASVILVGPPPLLPADLGEVSHDIAAIESERRVVRHRAKAEGGVRTAIVHLHGTALNQGQAAVGVGVEEHQRAGARLGQGAGPVDAAGSVKDILSRVVVDQHTERLHGP